MKSIRIAIAALLAIMVLPALAAAQQSGTPSFKTINGMQIVTLEDQNVTPRCVADGVTDCLPAFNAAMAKFSYVPFVRSGGQIRLNAGTYYVSAPVNMTGKYGIGFLGAGRISTSVASKGNYPVFTASGSYNSSLFGISIKDLNIVCGGKANANANGIAWSYVNNGTIDGNSFFSCNKAISSTGSFLTYVTNNNITGQGGQQNNNCLTTEFPTDVNDTFGNNALVVSHNLCQYAAGTGFRLIDANGSTFDHNQILAPNVGVYGCDQPSTTYPSGTAATCQFMFFDQDQVDTSASYGWLFKRGGGVAMGPSIILQQPWAGNTHTAAFSIDGGNDITIAEAEIQTTDAGVVLNNVSNSRVSGRISGYNAYNNSAASVLFSGTTTGNTVEVNAKTGFPVAGTYNGISETGSYSGNRLRAGVASCGIGVAFGGGTAGLTYTTGPATANQCRYEIDGLTVRLQYLINLSAKGTSTGAATLTGLPVISAPAVGWGYGSVNSVLGVNATMTGLTGPIQAKVSPNATTADLITQAAAGTANVTDTNFTNTGTITGSLEYFKP